MQDPIKKVPKCLSTLANLNLHSMMFSVPIKLQEWTLHYFALTEGKLVYAERPITKTRQNEDENGFGESRQVQCAHSVNFD